MSVTVFPASNAGKIQKADVITSTGSWVVPAGVTQIEVFAVGGGGGGGYANSDPGAVTGGGGGGGGARIAILSVTPGQSHTVTIGAGGAGATNSAVHGSAGSNTTFGSLVTAFGGGGGATYGVAEDWTILSKGTGGGQRGYLNSNGYLYGGGGGGAGSNANALSASTIDQSVPYSHGVQGFGGAKGGSAMPNAAGKGLNNFGGGGGGGLAQDQSQSVNAIMRNSGVDGGGDGAYTSNVNTNYRAAQSGTVNTGGGGGGGAKYYGTTGTVNAGASGGSGICIIKYWA